MKNVLDPSSKTDELLTIAQLINIVNAYRKKGWKFTNPMVSSKIVNYLKSSSYYVSKPKDENEELYKALTDHISERSKVIFDTIYGMMFDKPADQDVSNSFFGEAFTRVGAGQVWKDQAIKGAFTNPNIGMVSEYTMIKMLAEGLIIGNSGVKEYYKRLEDRTKSVMEDLRKVMGKTKSTILNRLKSVTDFLFPRTKYFNFDNDEEVVKSKDSKALNNPLARKYLNDILKKDSKDEMESTETSDDRWVRLFEKFREKGFAPSDKALTTYMDKVLFKSDNEEAAPILERLAKPDNKPLLALAEYHKLGNSEIDKFKKVACLNEIVAHDYLKEFYLESDTTLVDSIQNIFIDAPEIGGLVKDQALEGRVANKDKIMELLTMVMELTPIALAGHRLTTGLGDFTYHKLVELVKIMRHDVKYILEANKEIIAKDRLNDAKIFIELFNELQKKTSSSDFDKTLLFCTCFDKALTFSIYSVYDNVRVPIATLKKHDKLAKRQSDFFDLAKSYDYIHKFGKKRHLTGESSFFMGILNVVRTYHKSSDGEKEDVYVESSAASKRKGRTEKGPENKKVKGGSTDVEIIDMMDSSK